MRKVFFILLLCVIAAGFLPIDSGAAKKKIDTYCVITTCQGTICHESFKDSERAADYLDAVEEECENSRR